MFKLTTITRAGVVAVVCVAVAAPQALAKSPVKGAKAKAAKVQSVKQSASSGGESAVLRAALSTAYAQGCLNGTLPDRTMGGDNNNYEYYGDVCTVSVPLNGPSLALLATVSRRQPLRPPVACSTTATPTTSTTEAPAVPRSRNARGDPPTRQPVSDRRDGPAGRRSSGLHHHLDQRPKIPRTGVARRRSSLGRGITARPESPLMGLEPGSNPGGLRLTSAEGEW